MDIKKLRMIAIQKQDRTMAFEYNTKFQANDQRKQGHFIDCYTGLVQLDPDEKMLKGKNAQTMEGLHDKFGNLFRYYTISVSAAMKADPDNEQSSSE
jgi:hypothetical protein